LSPVEKSKTLDSEPQVEWMQQGEAQAQLHIQKLHIEYFKENLKMHFLPESATQLFFYSNTGIQSIEW